MAAEFTRQDCERWILQPDQNPKTNRKIKVDAGKGGIYGQLVKACQAYGLTPGQGRPPQAAPQPTPRGPPPLPIVTQPNIQAITPRALIPAQPVQPMQPLQPLQPMQLQPLQPLQPLQLLQPVQPSQPAQTVRFTVTPPQRPVSPVQNILGITLPTIPRLPGYEDEEAEEEEAEGDEEEENNNIEEIGDLTWDDALVAGDLVTLYRYFKQFPDELTLRQNFPRAPYTLDPRMLIITSMGARGAAPLVLTKDDTDQPTQLTIG